MPKVSEGKKFEKAKKKCQATGTVVNPRTRRCIDPQGSIAKAYTERALKNPDGFRHMLKREGYTQDEAKAIVDDFARNSVKSKPKPTAAAKPVPAAKHTAAATPAKKVEHKHHHHAPLKNLKKRAGTVAQPVAEPPKKKARTGCSKKLKVCESEVTKDAMKIGKLKKELADCRMHKKARSKAAARVAKGKLPMSRKREAAFMQEMDAALGMAPAGAVGAAQAAAGASAAAVVQAVGDGMVTKREAPQLAFDTAMTVMRNRAVVTAAAPAQARRRIAPIPVESAAAAAASTAVMQHRPISGVKKTTTSKEKETFARHVEETVQHLVHAHKLQQPTGTGDDALREVENRMGPGAAYREVLQHYAPLAPGEEPGSSHDIYESNIGDVAACRGKFLFVHSGKHATEPEQRIIDALNAKHTSLESLVNKPDKMVGTCLIWGKIDLPDDDEQVEALMMSMEKAMRKVIRVLVVHKDAANDIVASMFEPIYHKDIFEGFKTYDAVQSRYA